MIALRDPKFALTPEWGERFTVQSHQAADGHWRLLSSCNRCGARKEENQSRRNARIAAGQPYVCRDCALVDPYYAQMIRPNITLD